ncbi:insulinase family protein, partial [Ralstonia sp.]|uniref:insulinase family protein n=1 Tax=Ralstonia sp. TaxID=54061 RepID=UPI001A5AFC48
MLPVLAALPEDVHVQEIGDVFTPGSRRERPVRWREGLTAAELLPEGWDRELAQLAIDGDLKEASDWEESLSPGCFVTLLRTPGAPGGAFVAIVAQAIASTVINVFVYNRAIQWIFPFPQLPRRANQESVYGWFGPLANYAPRGLPVPVVYGQHRVGGAVVSAFVEVENGLNPQSYLFVLLLLSAGPIEDIGGIAVDSDGLTGVALPSTLQINGNDAQNFADIDTQIASITPEDACTFIGKHYVASNATLVVTGNVDPIEVLSLAKKYLGGLPKVAPPARPVVPPAKFLSKNVQIEAPVKKPSAMILFRQPPRFTPDAVAAQAALQTMLTAVAFFTRNKRESVVKKWNYTGLGGGEAQLIGIEIETEKVRDLDRGVDEVLDAITRGFSPELKGKDGKGTYDSVRQRTRLELLSQLANIGARSGAYADYLDERTDNPGMLGKELFLLDELKPERAQKVGRKWFSREEAMVIKVVPDGSEQAKIDRASFGYEPKEEDQMSVPDDIDPAEAHEPLKVNVATTEAGQSIEYQLENGMPVVLVQSTDIPVMDIQVIVRAGEVDSEKHAAIADLSNSLFSLQEGDRDGANLMQFFDLAGGVFGSNVGPKATTFTSRGLSVYLDFIIAGLSQIVVNAGYQTSSLELWKLSEKKRLEKPSYLQRANRERAFNEALFGKGHPHIRPAITNPKVLRDLKLSDLEAFREKHYRAANSAIIITGGFDMELAIQYIERYFGSPLLRERGNTWNEPRTGTTRKTAPEPKPGKVRYMTEMDKKKVQTDVFIAYPMAEVYGEDHAALLVLAAMLNFNVAAVRMKLGASYGIYSRVDASRPSLVIGGALDSAKAGEGFGAIKQAVQAVR